MIDIVYLIFGLTAVLSAVSGGLIKIYRQNIEDDHVGDNLYYVVMIIVSLVLYSILSKFDLRVNLITLVFSALYAVICYVSVTLNMRALQNAEMNMVSIFSNSGAVLWNTLWGITLFKEEFTFFRALGIVAVLMAVIIPYMAEKNGQMKSSKGMIYCFAIFALNSCTQLIVKIYSVLDCVKGNSVFCFYTNVILIPFIFLILKRHSSVKKIMGDILKVKPKNVILVASAILLSSIVTILGIFTIGQVDLLVYSVMEKSAIIIMTALVSRLMFKEKITVVKMVSFALIVGAVIAVI